MKRFFLLLLITSYALACPYGYELPRPVHIPLGVTEGGITEEEFMKISTELEQIYTPEVSSRGGNLKVYKEWASSEANSYAQREKEEWKVILLGGIARHKFMTADGFALIVCHEIGHHLGGVPRYDGIDIGWATNEGQSDYFSTMKCLRRYWEKSDNAQAIAHQNVPETLLNQCGKSWKWNRDEALCIRSGMAGLSAANVFASLAWNLKKPKFETPDTKEVKETYSAHPKAQCRLDTYFQGALCEASFLEEMATETQGSCHEAHGQTIGVRPHCWFKPTL
jgi:hypothetical protein